MIREAKFYYPLDSPHPYSCCSISLRSRFFSRFRPNLTVTSTDEFKFDPAVLTVKAGSEVNLTFKNGSVVEHSFDLLNFDAEIEHVLGETEEEHIHEELLLDIHELEGGGSETVSFTAPTEPGDYTFACLLAGHAQAGEVGTMKVIP